MIWSCSNRVTVGYPASTQVFGPELANCRPAICSPRPAPPGSTRTLIDVQVDFVAVVVGAGVLLLRGGGARRSAGVLALSDEVRGRIGVPGAADETLAGAVGGMLFVLDVNSVQPSSFGMPYELYAIAAAVLGGCSLRGGEGTIAGVIIGAAVMQALYNAINMLAFPTHIEWAIIGTVLLLGIIADELTKRFTARRKVVT